MKSLYSHVFFQSIYGIILFFAMFVDIVIVTILLILYGLIVYTIFEISS